LTERGQWESASLTYAFFSGSRTVKASLGTLFFQEPDAGLTPAGMLWVVEIKSFGLASVKAAS